MNGRSTTSRDMRRRYLRFAYAGGVISFALTIVGLASAQSNTPPAGVAPNPTLTARNTDFQAGWTESLGEPTIYVEHARADVGRGHYKSAARNLRKAAAILAERMPQAYGLDRRRIGADVAALRLTARDVAAGAISTPALLDSVLNTTHADLRPPGRAPR